MRKGYKFGRLSSYGYDSDVGPLHHEAAWVSCSQWKSNHHVRMAKTGLAWNGIALATRAENAYWPIALNLGSFLLLQLHDSYYNIIRADHVLSAHAHKITIPSTTVTLLH
jgi:hypothetical protein